MRATKDFYRAEDSQGVVERAGPTVLVAAQEGREHD